jgi:hypothetical protein
LTGSASSGPGSRISLPKVLDRVEADGIMRGFVGAADIVL